VAGLHFMHCITVVSTYLHLRHKYIFLGCFQYEQLLFRGLRHLQTNVFEITFSITLSKSTNIRTNSRTKKIKKSTHYYSAFHRNKTVRGPSFQRLSVWLLFSYLHFRYCC